MGSTGMLIIGKHEDRYIDRNAHRLHQYATEAGIESARIDYHELFSSQPKHISNANIIVAFFFPYKFWDENCEVPKDTKLYGTSMQSYGLFRKFWSDVEQALGEKYAGRKLDYLIHPSNAFVDRDKIETIRRLAERHVPVTETIETRTLGEILEQPSPERGVFIKCRYGAEGKGITYISTEGWVTNYRVERERLDNYGAHEAWPFTDITGRKDLLEQLLQHEVIIEKELVTPELEPGTKFDIRTYVIKGDVPHMFLRINQKKMVVTNCSQGAKVEHMYRWVLPREFIDAARKASIAAAQALDAKFTGVDCMFHKGCKGIAVVETQMFADFPDIDKFNMARHLIRRTVDGNIFGF